MKRLCIVPCGAKKIWDVAPGTGRAATDLQDQLNHQPNFFEFMGDSFRFQQHLLSA